MSDIKATTEDLVRDAIAQLAQELSIPQLHGHLPGDFDIFGAVDSFTVVELLMITEAKVEEADGTYVALADEKLFDAAESPLHSLASWIDYVARRRTHG